MWKIKNKIIFMLVMLTDISVSIAADYTSDLYYASRNNSDLEECIELSLKYIADFMDIYNEYGDENMITSRYFYSNELRYDSSKGEDVEYDFLINRKTFRYNFKGDPVDVTVCHTVGSKTSTIMVSNIVGDVIFFARFVLSNETLYRIDYFEIPGDESSIVTFR